MSSAYIKFLRQLLIFSGIFGSATLIITLIIPTEYVSPALPFLFFFFIATSLLSFYFLLHSTKSRFIKFVNTYLLTIVIKLFIYAGIMIVYVLINRRDAIPFMLGFFIIYLFYTIFEAVSIIRYSQPPSQDNKAL